MTEPSKQEQQEPSMEEILASIRRIISDDGSEQAEAQEAKPAAPASGPAPGAGSAAPGPEADGDPETAAEADEEPLELTQALQADGTVIDLASQRAARPAPEAAPEAAEPETAEPLGDTAASIDEGSLDLPQAEETAAEPLVEDDAMPEEETEQDRLVSQATEAATLTALSELARNEGREPRPLSLPGGQRTLEQVVRDAIAEHLREWLDANLPTLVERIVRDEVRRLARRAEDT